MAGSRLSSQDRRDLERFSKFLVYKSLQIIVQSRSGDKGKTYSKSQSSGLDWFNIAIRDLPAVQSEVKKLLSGSVMTVGFNICMEITLRSGGGETMTLEVWHISIVDQYDLNMRTAQAAYDRMGIALKSLFCVSRILPAYKLSRQQKETNFVICHRMYYGEPKRYLMGDGPKLVNVVSIPMTTGTISIQVLYRTNLNVSSSSLNIPCFDLHLNHFNDEKCTTCHIPPLEVNRDKNCYPEVGENTSWNDVSDLHTCDAGSSQIAQTNNVTHTDICEPIKDSFLSTPPMTFTKRRSISGVEEPSCKQSSPICKSPLRHVRQISAFSQQHSLKDFVTDLDDVPFEMLLNTNGIIAQNLTSTEKTDKEATKAPSVTSLNEGASSSITATVMAGPPKLDSEDFVMLDLNTPFAAQDSGSELNKFYRDFQTAPSLTFEPDSDSEKTLTVITEQLQIFENNKVDFDHFIFNLQDCD